jgi:hypothetical protein
MNSVSRGKGHLLKCCMGVMGAALSTTFSYTLHALMTVAAYSTISGVK